MFIVWVFAIAFVALAAERLRPGWKLPKVQGWMRRVVLLNGFQLASVFIAGWTWDHAFQSWSLFRLDSLAAPLAGLLVYVIQTFIYYWWHRWRHTVPWLWRVFHQVHHSPRRIEVLTSFYKHPFEIVANSLLTSSIVYTLLGAGLEAAAWNTLFSASAEFFYHLNMKTPVWVGYVIQRPEMHHVHHQRDRHSSNYGDLPLWDMLFGTYENPREFTAECGFDPALELELGAMLRCTDVHERAREAAPALTEASP